MNIVKFYLNNKELNVNNGGGIDLTNTILKGTPTAPELELKYEHELNDNSLVTWKTLNKTLYGASITNLDTNNKFQLLQPKEDNTYLMTLHVPNKGLANIHYFYIQDYKSPQEIYIHKINPEGNTNGGRMFKLGEEYNGEVVITVIQMAYVSSPRDLIIANKLL